MKPAWIFAVCSVFFFFHLNVHLPTAVAQTTVKFLIAVESTAAITDSLQEIISTVQKETGRDHLIVEPKIVEIDRYDLETSEQKVCEELANGVTLILDMTWTGWEKLQKLAEDHLILYERTDSMISPYVVAISALLEQKKATDIAFIFDNERDLNESLYHLIGRSILRLVVIDELNDMSVSRIRDMRPSPTYYAIYANTANMTTLFQTAIDGGLVTRNNTWNLVFTDNNYNKFKYIAEKTALNVSIGVATIDPKICCEVMGQNPCVCPPDFQMFPVYFKRLITFIVTTLITTSNNGATLEPKSVECKSQNSTSLSNTTVRLFQEYIEKGILASNGKFESEQDKSIIYNRVIIDLGVLENGRLENIGNWSRNEQIMVHSGKEIVAARRHFRVGTNEAIPWSYIKKDPDTGLPVKDANGKDVWTGYCIDFIEELSLKMGFDYELVIPKDGQFGNKLPDGKWSGLVGDLAGGAIDIAVGALTMTSDREDIVDFVAPYFEQSGLLIVMRKPVRETSLFRFMTVLKVEVWLSIVGALTLTGIMIWILDKYSPYSARNNKKIYPYPCREFTLKESFWFALTSFTPQGGGEAPKALSSRTLVAAYWLFVVLMLATFTANLAAFLTVERMQSPVQSLEQLARQSKINYTVMANSSIHQYFINMDSAEEKLYTVWKDITLNSTSDQIEYRVWDYPIKEQYGHILQAIKQGGPVATAREGFDKVIASQKAEFAFIHDSAEIKYEVSRNCNLTEVGEVFAEQPYAIAVQQGSHLQEEISRMILSFQKDRKFEQWTGKYWNHSMKGQCPNSDDNEGITLESLGGVFIATLFGLALAMITLAGEVVYYRRKNAQQSDKEKEVERAMVLENEKSIMDKITANLKMKPAPTMAFVDRPLGPRARISHISVYPRSFPFKD